MMSQVDPMSKWRNYDEAMTKARGLTDPVERQFVMMALTAAIERAADPQTAPDEPLDLVFLVDVMRELCGRRQALARVLAGEDLRWWPDDEG